MGSIMSKTVLQLLCDGTLSSDGTITVGDATQLPALHSLLLDTAIVSMASCILFQQTRLGHHRQSIATFFSAAGEATLLQKQLDTLESNGKLRSCFSPVVETYLHHMVKILIKVEQLLTNEILKLDGQKMLKMTAYAEKLRAMLERHEALAQSAAAQCAAAQCAAVQCNGSQCTKKRVATSQPASPASSRPDAIGSSKKQR